MRSEALDVEDAPKDAVFAARVAPARDMSALSVTVRNHISLHDREKKLNSVQLNRGISIAALGASVLAGCGGGGGGSGDVPPATVTSAEGVYGGTLTGSASSAFQALVLENDEFWAIYGVQTGSSFLVAGFIQGQGASSNGSFTSSSTKDFGYLPAQAATTSATYNVTAKTFTGTVTGAAGTTSLSGGPVTGSLYNYAVPTSLATIVGSWTATALTGEGLNISVAANGTFSATSSLGCTFSGTIAARPSGKNVFNVALTFGPAPCTLPNQAATGIALAYPVSTGRTQVIVAAINTARTAGVAAFGIR